MVAQCGENFDSQIKLTGFATVDVVWRKAEIFQIKSNQIVYFVWQQYAGLTQE